MIVNLFYVPAKGSEKVACDCATLVANQGMVNDYHYGSDRLITIMTKELFDKLEQESGLCFARFKPNLVVDDTLIEGTYQIGNSILEVKHHAKKCFAECSREHKENCPMKKGILDGIVVHGGTVCRGDLVRVLK